MDKGLFNMAKLSTNILLLNVYRTRRLPRRRLFGRPYCSMQLSTHTDY